MNFSCFYKYRFHYLVILVIVIFIIIYILSSQGEQTRGTDERYKQDGNGELYYLGRGSEDESIAVLLDRIEWSTYLEKRTPYWERALFTSFIITLLVLFLVMEKIPHPGYVVLLIFVVFIPIYAVANFIYTHGDVYNDYYIKTNAQLIRDKLGLESNPPPPPNDSNIPDRPYVMKFPHHSK